jgi:hypothetical protein
MHRVPTREALGVCRLGIKICGGLRGLGCMTSLGRDGGGEVWMYDDLIDVIEVCMAMTSDDD